MSRFVQYLSLTIVILALAIPASGSAGDNNRQIRIDLSGFQ